MNLIPNDIYFFMLLFAMLLPMNLHNIQIESKNEHSMNSPRFPQKELIMPQKIIKTTFSDTIRSVVEYRNNNEAIPFVFFCKILIRCDVTKLEASTLCSNIQFCRILLLSSHIINKNNALK